MSEIRSMREADMQEVLRIERLCFSCPWPEEAFTPSAVIEAWVICRERLVAGYILYHSVLDESVIINFAVDPQFQRQGLGRELLERTLSMMSVRGVRNIFLDVRAANAAAQNLYLQEGFRPIGRRKGYYTLPDEDAIVMVKRMGPDEGL